MSAHLFLSLFQRIGELERRMSGMVQRGPVTDVDPAKGLVRIAIGEKKDGTLVKSPWVPYAQVAGGKKLHSAPTVGQQLEITTPAGDLRQGTARVLGWSNPNPSPSGSPEDSVFTQGDTSIKVNGGEIEFKVGGTSIHMNGNGIELKKGGSSLTIIGAGNIFTNGLDIEGGKVLHDAVNIGKTHGHITAPPGPPGPPVS